MPIIIDRCQRCGKLTYLEGGTCLLCTQELTELDDIEAELGEPNEEED